MSHNQHADIQPFIDDTYQHMTTSNRPFDEYSFEQRDLGIGHHEFGTRKDLAYGLRAWHTVGIPGYVASAPSHIHQVLMVVLVEEVRDVVDALQIALKHSRAT